MAVSGSRDASSDPRTAGSPGGSAIKSPFERWAPIVLCCLLASLFVAQLLALAAHRLDYPINDDWRYYQNILHGSRMPVALSLDWLFEPAWDTVHATGKLLDWLTFRWLAHDYHLLAVTSFFVWFGGWALASTLLALRFTRDEPLLRVAGLAAFALPLAASPYWVTVSPLQRLEPAIAYHQMMPVVGLSLLCLLCTRERGSHSFSCVLAAIATAFFSLVYSSGAISLLLFGAAVLALTQVAGRPTSRGRLAGLGVVIAATAALCLALHIVLPMSVYDMNPVVDARRKGMTLPHERNFWLFFLGLFDRSLLSLSTGPAGWFRGIAVAAAIIVPGFVLAILAVRRTLRESERSAGIALVSLLASVIGYALLLSYGRAAFGDAYFLERDDPATRASRYAHSRFFYWWIAAILPFATIAVGKVLASRYSPRIAGVAALLLVTLALGSALPGRHSWDYAAHYKRDAVLVMGLIEKHREGSIRRSKRYIRARETKATFVDRWKFPRRNAKQRTEKDL